MNTKSQKHLAAKILKVGVSRVRVHQTKEVADAITKQDIRDLVQKDMIKAVQKKGTSKAHSRVRLKQKKRGRRKGRGSTKGAAGAFTPRKKKWIKSVRAMRRSVNGLKDHDRIEMKDYRFLYKRIKGGMFRSKRHMLSYIREKEMMKGGKK